MKAVMYYWYWCLYCYLSTRVSCPAGHRNWRCLVRLLLLYSCVVGVTAGVTPKAVLCCWSWFIIDDVGRKQSRSGGVCMSVNVYCSDRTDVLHDVSLVYVAMFVLLVCRCKHCMSLGRWLRWGSQRTSREMWKSLRSGTVAGRKCMWFR